MAQYDWSTDLWNSFCNATNGRVHTPPNQDLILCVAIEVIHEKILGVYTHTIAQRTPRIITRTVTRTTDDPPRVKLVHVSNVQTWSPWSSGRLIISEKGRTRRRTFRVCLGGGNFFCLAVSHPLVSKKIMPCQA